MTDTIAPALALDLGVVVRETSLLLRRRFLLLFGLSAVLVGAPNVAFLYYTARVEEMPGQWAASYGAFVIASFIAGVATAFAALEDLNGRRPSLAGSLVAGGRYFLPVLGVSICVGLCVTLGAIFLIVPGLIVLCAWFVPIQVVMSEGTGISAALDRSRDLTRGNRLRIFGLVAAYYVAFFAASVAADLIGGVSMLSGGVTPLSIAVNTVVTVLLTPLASVAPGVVYVELRKLREGQGAFGLAEIFS